MGQKVPGLQILHHMIGTLLVNAEGGIFSDFSGGGGSVRFVLAVRIMLKFFAGGNVEDIFSQERLFCVGPFWSQGVALDIFRYQPFSSGLPKIINCYTYM